VFKKNQNSLSSQSREYFNENLKTDLKMRSVRGGAITIIAQGSKFFLNLGSLAILGRLLTPNDYGLIGMVTPIVGFVEMFKDLGLSTATIQREEINHQQVSTLFWINLLVSGGISILFAALAPSIAWFYKEPRLVDIVLALSSIFLVGGLSIQHQALLKRKMQFASIAKIEITSVILGVLAAIMAAWANFGYWALVIMPLTKMIVIAIGSWLACPWRPGLPSKDAEIKSMLAFGGNLTGFNCINYFSRNLDNILIGQYWGATELGFYSKAYQLVLLPIQQINAPINNVALPLLSRLQAEPEQFTRYYYKFVLSIVFLGMPIVAFTFAVTDKLILFVLGEQWLNTVPIFQLLAPAAFLGTFNLASAWVYQSFGRTDRQLQIGLVLSTIDIIIFTISIRWGAIGVAAAYGLSRPFVWLPQLIHCYYNTPLKFKTLMFTLARPTFASITAALATMALDRFLLQNTQILIGLLIASIFYTFLYLAIWSILPNGKQTLIDSFNLLKELKNNPNKVVNKA
jgi:O-antigen/teichoic acid export membrane protein